MPGTAQQERAARAAGFPSYEAQIAWARQRMKKREPQTIDGASAEGRNAIRNAEGTNGSVENAMSWHPSVIFNHVADLLRGARR